MNAKKIILDKIEKYEKDKDVLSLVMLSKTLLDRLKKISGRVENIDVSSKVKTFPKLYSTWRHKKINIILRVNSIKNNSIILMEDKIGGFSWNGSINQFFKEWRVSK